ALLRYDYPRNIRELENIIERAIVLSRGDLLTVEDFFNHAYTFEPKKENSIKEVITSVERDMILEALLKNNWVQTKAANSLNMSERVLRYKMKKYGIKRS
ncbi:MAG TPA: helix-turn-helix domain-containing protein, partial [Syntrophorhabdaceae bacterium]|nr:helix-turn-helix domain-containing protein [Syntrophorhabdaceae bacterium]